MKQRSDSRNQPNSRPEAAAWLAVSFNDTTRVLATDDDLRIGRGTISDLHLDDANRFIHRRTARLWSDDQDGWRITNEGDRLLIRICDTESAAQRTLVPGADEPVGFDSATVRIRAAETDYMIHVETVDATKEADDNASMVMFTDEGFTHGDGYNDADTFTRSDSSHNIAAYGDQLRLLLALSEPLLADPHAELVLPTRAEIGHRFGWTTKAVDRKLDRLCGRFDRAGVAGLRGELGLNATDRMANLARFAIESGVVRPGDLAKLDTYA